MFWTKVHNIDQLLTLEINSWHSFITDPIWAFFSDKLVWAPMYAAIIADYITLNVPPRAFSNVPLQIWSL